MSSGPVRDPVSKKKGGGASSSLFFTHIHNTHTHKRNSCKNFIMHQVVYSSVEIQTKTCSCLACDLVELVNNTKNCSSGKRYTGRGYCSMDWPLEKMIQYLDYSVLRMLLNTHLHRTIAAETKDQAVSHLAGESEL